MTDTNDNPSSDSLAGDAQLTASDGNGTVSDTGTVSLTDLNKIFGTTFKDPDTALKAIKDTKSFVGKKVETPSTDTANIAPDQSIDPELKSTVQRLERDLFFSNNPQFKEHRALIESLGNPAEVVERPEVKSLLEKAKVADEVTSNKSVVHSSPRLAQTQDVVDSAIKVANTNASNEDVATVLAKGIQDEMRG